MRHFRGKLSPLQKQIAVLVAQQKTAKEIGAIIHRSKSRCDAIKKDIRRKTKSKNSIGIALYCVKQGWIKI